MNERKRILISGAEALGLRLDPARAKCLLQYLDLLAKWNRVYNLTAVRDPTAMVTHHLLDSLAAKPYVQGARLLDVGSGAGLPGLVLALADPDLCCTLLDSNAKKTRFLTQAAVELRLDNVEVVRSRIGDFHPPAGFDTIIARAFAKLADFYAVTARLCNPGGRLLTMKGAYPEEELDALAQPDQATVYRLHVPGLNAERHAVVMEV